MKRLSLIAGAFAVSASGAFAASVDFENEAPLAVDPTNVGMSYSNNGLNFSSTENMQLVQTGAPTSGFVPDDMPVPAGAFGDIFLTGDFNDNTDMTITNGSAFSDISFDIADIDGGNDNQSGESNEENFVFSFLLNNVVVDTIVINSNDVSGNGQVSNVSYAGFFDEISIVGTTPGGSRNIGWGIDNIRATEVPVPAALPLMLAGLGGLGFMARRKRKA